MDPFADLLGGFAAPAPTPAPASSSPTAASAFSFLGAPPPSQATPSVATPAPATSAFSFIASAAPVSSAPPIPASAFTGGGLNALALDSAFSSLGHTAVTSEPKPLGAPARSGVGSRAGTAAAVAISPDTDFASWGATKLKKTLDDLRVDHRACVEKSELVALIRSVVGAPSASSDPLRSGGSGATTSSMAGRASEWRSTGPVSALEMGMPNAFEVHGLKDVAPDAVKSINQQRMYEAKAATAGTSDLSAYFAATRSISVAQVFVPTMPAAKLRLRLPASLARPVFRELTQAAFLACHTELSASSAVAAAAAIGLSVVDAGAALSSSASGASGLSPGQRALLPFLSRTTVGPKRYYEAPLRCDVSDADVLKRLERASRSVGLDVTHRTPHSLILQQRVSVPYTSYSAFVGSQAVVGAGGDRTPVLVNEVPVETAAAGWLSSALGGNRPQLYVNSISVYIGTNARHARVATLVTSRYLPDPATDSQSPEAKVALYGRVVSKDRVGGQVVVAGATAAKARASTGGSSSILADLSATGGGILCRVVQPFDGPSVEYRSGSSSGGSEPGTGGSAPLPHAASTQSGFSDIFGMESPVHAQPAAAEGSAGADVPAVASEEARVLDVPNLPNALARVRATLSKIDAPVISAAADEAADSDITDVDAALSARFADDSILLETAAGGDSYRLGGSPVKVTSLPDWSTLRVWFLEVDVIPGPKTAIGTKAPIPAPSPSDALDILSLSASPVTPAGSPIHAKKLAFGVSDIADELVALTCELFSAVRSEKVLEESLWLDAITAARIALARARGEAIAAESADTFASPPAATSGGIGSFTAHAPTHGPAPSAADVFAAMDSAASKPVANVSDIFHVLEDASESAKVLISSPSTAATPLTTQHSTSTGTNTSVAPVLAGSVTLPQAAFSPGSLAVEDSSCPKFTYAVDALAAVSSGYKAVGEAHLFQAAAPYEAKAKIDEWLATQVGKALAPIYMSRKEALPKAPFVPRLDVVPLPPLPDVSGVVISHEFLLLSRHVEDSALATQQSTSTSATTAAGAGYMGTESPATMILPPTPDGLTPAEDTLREVYHRAYLVCRALKRVEVVHTALAAYEQALDMRRRLLRKKEHVSLRCGAAFYHAVHMVSQLQERDVADTNTSKALLISQFNVRNEAPLYHNGATALSVIGEVVLTVKRLAFYSNYLGYRTKRNIGLDTIVAVNKAPTMLMVDNTITITYVDDEKVVAKATKVDMKAPTTNAALPSSKSAAPSAHDVDVFGLETAVTQSSTPSTVSVKDAFDALCEIGDSADVPVGGTAAVPTAAALAGATAPGPTATSSSSGQAGAVGRRSSVLKGSVLDGLSHEDMMIFLNSGGAPDTLSQMHVTPTGADRDLLYYLIQLVRQLETRPHVFHFTFAPLVKPAGPDTSRLHLAVPRYSDYLATHARERGVLPDQPPFMFRPEYAASMLRGEAYKHAPSSSKQMMSEVGDLFAPPAPPAVNGAGAAQTKPKSRGESIVADIYADLADTMAAGAV